MSKYAYSPRFSLLFVFLMLLVSANLLAQATYYTRVTTGSWTTPATWSTVGCGGTAAATTPGVNDHVVICTGHTITFNAAVQTTIANLSIQTSGVLTMSVGRNLFVNSLVLDGLVNGNGTGDIRVGGIVGSTISGTGSFNTGANSGQIRLLRAVTVSAGTDLKFNGSGRFNLSGFVLTNNGKITIGSSSSFSGGGTFVNASSTSHLVFSRANNWPAGTTLTATATGNTVEFAAATGTRLMDNQGSYYHLIISGGGTKVFRAMSSTIRGNLTISNGATLDTNTGTRTLNIGGNWINNLGGTFNENTSLVIFNGSLNNQNLSPPSGATGELFYDLTINNTFASGSVTANGNVTITTGRTLTMTAGIFDVQANTLGQSGAANLTATGGDLRLAKISTTLPELTGTYSITGGTITFNGASAQTIRSLNAVPSNYHHIVLGGAGTKTLGGDITVRGDWSNGGTTLAGNFIVSFAGTGIQTITNASGENFYSVTVNTTGPLTLASNTIVNNTLTMTSGNINLSGQTLTVGNGGTSTLTRASGICYGGTFRRYFPNTAISSTGGSFYGLFPVGSSISYRPVQINSTVSPTTGGFVSVIHTDATTATDVSYNDNEATPIQRVTNMRSAISTATLAGGTYTLSVSFTTLSSAGSLASLKLETQAGPPFGVGTSDPTTGSVSSPTGVRRLLNETQLNNIFVIGTTDKSVTPLVSSFYSRRTGNWDDVTAGNSTWSLTDSNISCNCVPTASSIVYINTNHTVTVNTPATTDFVNIRSGATLNGTANLTVNFDIRTEASGRIAPTGGSWSIGRSLIIAGASSSTSAASLTIASNLQVDAGNSLTLGANSSVAGNVIVDGTLGIGTTTLTLSGNGASISGLNGTINGSGGTITLSTSKTIASGSVLTFQPVLNLLAAVTITNQGSVTTNGNITGASGSTSIWTNTSGSSLTTSAANLLSTGVLNASASPNTVTYNGSGAQSIKTPATSYYDLVIANANTKSTSGAFSVVNLLTIQDAAILNTGTNQLNGAGGLTMTGTSEFIIARAGNATYPELAGVYSLTGGTITLSPASNTYTLRAVDYNNLTLSGSGTSTFNFGAVANTVNNAFTYNSTSSNSSTNNRDLTVGTFTLTAGTFITSTAPIIEITGAGGWTRNGGTFTPSANTKVLFSGSTDQQIGGSVATTFTDFELSNSGPVGVILNQDMAISGTFSFTSGNLVTSSTNILTMNSGSALSGTIPPSDDSFVEGPMEKIGNGDFTFPVGKDGSYRPIGVSNLSGSETFRAEYFHLNPNASGYNTASKDISLVRVNRGEYWVLGRTGSQTAEVTLSWDDYSGVVDEINDLRVAGWDGATWKDRGNNTGLSTGFESPGTGTITSGTAVSLFGPFTLATSSTNNPLPIELVYFKGELLNEQVLLTWQTASEVNNNYFTVQKSKDGKDFEDVGKVDGSGTTNQTHQYSLSDPNPHTNISYYRLKQTDFDGTFEYSKLIAIDNRAGEEEVVVEAFPNPSHGGNIVTISYRGLPPDETAGFFLMNNNGNLLVQSKSQINSDGKFTFVMNTNEYTQGVYIFMLQTSKGRKTAKVMID